MVLNFIELSLVWATGLSLCCVVPVALLTHQMPQVSAPNFCPCPLNALFILFMEFLRQEYWNGLRREWQRMRWLDGIIDSMDMSWENSGRWWRTGKPGVLQSMRSQRVRHGWAAEQHPVPTVLIHWLLAMRLILLCARRAGNEKAKLRRNLSKYFLGVLRAWGQFQFESQPGSTHGS